LKKDGVLSVFLFFVLRVVVFVQHKGGTDGRTDGHARQLLTAAGQKK
jgi:preprotein translocase subunit SecG